MGADVERCLECEGLSNAGLSVKPICQRCFDDQTDYLQDAVVTTEDADTDNLFCSEPGCGEQFQMDRRGLDMAREVAINAAEEGWRGNSAYMAWCPTHAFEGGVA